VWPPGTTRWPRRGIHFWIASLPFQNYFTIASTLGSLAAFVPPVNAATGAFFQGQWDMIPPLLQQAVTAEIAAIAAVIQLPATIITYDLGVIAGASDGASSAAVGNTVAVSAADAPAAAATAADPVSGLLAIASLPFQNYFTIASTLGSLARTPAPTTRAPAPTTTRARALARSNDHRARLTATRVHRGRRYGPHSS
jgi:hypothetical protein